MCYERGWEARKRNEEASAQIRRLFARYRAEAQRGREVADDDPRTGPERPPIDVTADPVGEPGLH